MAASVWLMYEREADLDPYSQLIHNISNKPRPRGCWFSRPRREEKHLVPQYTQLKSSERNASC